MTVYVNNQYRLATWDHDLAGAGSLTDEHRKKTIHGDNDWICAHFQRDPQSRILWDQKKKLNVNCNQIWKAVWLWCNAIHIGLSGPRRTDSTVCSNCAQVVWKRTANSLHYCSRYVDFCYKIFAYFRVTITFPLNWHITLLFLLNAWYSFFLGSCCCCCCWWWWWWWCCCCCRSLPAKSYSHNDLVLHANCPSKLSFTSLQIDHRPFDRRVRLRF